MKVIGVTGGVGAGKSEVLGYIAGNWNATVVEADEVGYLVMRPGKACYSAIVDLFGAGILKEDETLDREQIAKIVFEDKEMLAKMNAIVHPAVKEYIRKAIKREEENETDIFIVEAALLIEDKYDEICDELWYIYADEETRMERLKQNRGYSEEKCRSSARKNTAITAILRSTTAVISKKQKNRFNKRCKGCRLMRLCSIASGSSGNCIYVGSDTTHLLVDTGISGKKVEFGLNSLDLTTGDLDGILVTHEHSYHIKGLGVVARICGVPIYATAGTIRSMEDSGSLGKMPEGIFHEVIPDQDCPIGDLTVHPFRISHDAAEPVAYRIGQGKREVGIATDMGVYDDYIVENLKGLDALLLEANHDVNMLQVGKYPYYLKRRILGDKGHLSNETAGQLLCQLLHDNMKQILLGHLSRENNYEALAYETVCAEVTMGDNPYKAKDFRIDVAHRDTASEVVEV